MVTITTQLKYVPVELWDGVSSSLANIRGEVSTGLLDGEHHYGSNNWNSNTGQHPQSTSTNKLIGILKQFYPTCNMPNNTIAHLKSFLKGTDGQ